METNHKYGETVQVVVSTLLEKMDISAEVIIEAPTLPLQGEFVCHIHVFDTSSLLIGQRGSNLEAFQLISRLLVRRQCDGWADFSVDVNGYWQKKSHALIEEALVAAQRAELENIPIVLRPMTSFERKCVHLAMVDCDRVVTESVGLGEDRSVSVKPKNI